MLSLAQFADIGDDCRLGYETVSNPGEHENSACTRETQGCKTCFVLWSSHPWWGYALSHSRDLSKLLLIPLVTLSFLLSKQIYRTPFLLSRLIVSAFHHVVFRYFIQIFIASSWVFSPLESDGGNLELRDSRSSWACTQCGVRLSCHSKAHLGKITGLIRSLTVL